MAGFFFCTSQEYKVPKKKWLASYFLLYSLYLTYSLQFFSILSRALVFNDLEEAVEVRHVVETAFIGNLGYRLVLVVE